MLNVVVIGYGVTDTASTRFRFVNMLPALAAHGVAMKIYYRADLQRDELLSDIKAADVIVNQKLLVSSKQGNALVASGKPLVFDFDDALWTRPGRPYGWWAQWRVSRRLRYWLRQADHVTVANNHLASFARRTNKAVWEIPMALPRADTTVASRSEYPITLGWMGAPGNLPGLQRLSGVLERVLSAVPGARLSVFCGKRPELPFDFEWTAFDPALENSFANSLDIGLLPLPDDDYSKGKSPIKALFYMNSGAVVVGNVSGASRQILRPEHSLAVKDDAGWEDALINLARDAALRARMANAAKAFVAQHHSIDAAASSMAKLYKSLA